MTDRQFIDELIRAINDYRANHQVEPLKHNAVISTVSQSWSDRLARSGAMEHNPKRSYNGQPLGENIAMKWTSDRQNYTGKEATDQWYDEIKMYNFGQHAGRGTGHFTQVVWKSSREIGVGRSQSRDGKWFVVANFFPAGNVLGQFAENVLRPRSGKLPAARGSPKPKETVKPAGAATPVSHSPWSRATQPDAAIKTSPNATTLTVGPRVLPSATIVERKQHTRTKDGVTKTTVIETHRGSDGRVTTVTKETVGSSGVAGAATSSGLKEVSLSFNTLGINEPYSSRSQLLAGAKVPGGMERTRDQAQAGTSMVSLSSDGEFANQVVRQHNVYRRQHGNVGDLKLNADMCKKAEQWARHLACIDRLQHSNSKHSRTGEPLGENIAYKYSSYKDGYTGEEVVSQWYGEIKHFSFRNPELCVSSCGHFTQVVWKGSTEVGVGRAMDDSGLRVFVVCNYFPAGNVIGRFKENVFPCK